MYAALLTSLVLYGQEEYNFIITLWCCVCRQNHPCYAHRKRGLENFSSKTVCSPHPLPPSSSFAFNLSHIRVFSSESSLHIRWPKYWSLALASVFPMNIQGWFPLGLTGLIFLLSKGLSKVISSGGSSGDFIAQWSYDETWCTKEGNGKPLQYSCLKNPMISMKKSLLSGSETVDNRPRLSCVSSCGWW